MDAATASAPKAELAFAIMGSMFGVDGQMNVMAVLFVPPHCDGMLKNGQLHSGLLKTMGFQNPTSEKCTIQDSDGHSHAGPTIYFFERVPQPSRVFVAEVGGNGRIVRSNGGVKARRGEPHEIIPAIDSPLARAHLYKNGLAEGLGLPLRQTPQLVPRPKKVFAR